METRPTPDQSLAKLLRVTVVLLVVLLGVSALLLHIRLVTGLDADDENARTESECLYGLRQVCRGANLYRDYTKAPYVLTPYTPLFYLVPGETARLAGGGDLRTVLIGRAYVYGCWVGIGLLIYCGARQEKLNIRYCLLAAGLWMAGVLAWRWSFSYRPDAPALFFALAGFLLFRRQPRSRSTIVVAGFLMAIAFLHKHSMITAPVIVVGSELLARRYRIAFLISLIWWGLVAVSLGITQLASGGTFFMNVFTILNRPQPESVPMYLMAALLAGLPVFAGAFLAVYSLRKQLINKPLCLYFVVSFGVGLLTSSKSGSNVNYYLEAYAVGCLLVGGMCSDWTETTGTRLRRWVAIIWYALAFGWTVETLMMRINDLPTWRRALTEHRELREAEREDWERVLARLAREQGPLLIEDNYLEFRQGGEPYMLNIANFAAMVRTGQFDERNLLERFASGSFGAIVTTDPLEARVWLRPFPDRWIEIIRSHYQLIETVPINSLEKAVYIYRPGTDKSGRN